MATRCEQKPKNDIQISFGKGGTVATAISATYTAQQQIPYIKAKSTQDTLYLLCSALVRCTQLIKTRSKTK